MSLEAHSKNEKNVIKTDIKLKEAINIAELRKNQLLNNIKILNEKIIQFDDKIQRYEILNYEAKESENVKIIIKIGKELGLNLNPAPNYLNLCKEIIYDTINKNIKKIQTQKQKIRQDIKKTEEEISNIYICPSCGGAGTIIKVQHLREDGRIITLKHPQECTICKGRGKIK